MREITFQYCFYRQLPATRGRYYVNLLLGLSQVVRQIVSLDLLTYLKQKTGYLSSGFLIFTFTESSCFFTFLLINQSLKKGFHYPYIYSFIRFFKSFFPRRFHMCHIHQLDCIKFTILLNNLIKHIFNVWF